MDDRPEPTMAQIKIRCREDLKRRLETQAKAEKRSVNDVVISRLEESYNSQDVHAAMIRERFGDEKSFKTICAIAASWDLISSAKGSPWHQFPETVDMATASAAYAIGLINSGLPDRMPELERQQAEEMRQKLRLFIGYGAAKLAFNVLEGNDFDEHTARNIQSDLEELRKLDIVAWYEAEKRAGRVPADQSDEGSEKSKTQ